MSVLKVYKYPHPVLREVCQPVHDFDERLRELAADMQETMYHSFGAVGLAAPQVGVPIRMMVIDVTAKTTREGLKVLVNPVIVQKSRNKLVREGCLSFPEYLANIKRAQRVTVNCQDIFGETVTYELDGFEAVAVQHELDHLDGVLLIDRVQSLKTDLIRRHNAPPLSETALNALESSQRPLPQDQPAS
jgi:peptide deformylase